MINEPSKKYMPRVIDWINKAKVGNHFRYSNTEGVELYIRRIEDGYEIMTARKFIATEDVWKRLHIR